MQACITRRKNTYTGCACKSGLWIADIDSAYRVYVNPRGVCDRSIVEAFDFLGLGRFRGAIALYV